MKNNYIIGKNEIGYDRFDFIIVDKIYKPYIVEINSSAWRVVLIITSNNATIKYYNIHRQIYL